MTGIVIYQKVNYHMHNITTTYRKLIYYSHKISTWLLYCPATTQIDGRHHPINFFRSERKRAQLTFSSIQL